MKGFIRKHFLAVTLRQRILRVALVLILLAAGAYLSFGVLKIIRWKAYIWLPEYARMQFEPKETVPDNQKHAILVFVDHYEPGVDPREAVRNHEAWLTAYRKATEGHQDTYGNRVKYTWYYPYDQRIDDVLISLTQAVHQGLGEVELHWHHPPSTNERFPGELRQAIEWFGQYGSLKTCGNTVKTAFSFIHGNWALDNSVFTQDGKPICGVSREIDILHEQGGYADFTFSTIDTTAQPSKKLNAIYYVTDSDDSKSYDDGEPVRVGDPVDNKFMIVQGPMAIYPLEWWRLEFAAVENHALPNMERINNWIDANVHVSGRPEWVFVKTYSHGIQSDKIVRDHFDEELTLIEQVTRKRGIKLHYMSAREAYNVIKAAEAGKQGNPELYRDFLIPKPCNYYFHTSEPGAIFGFENGRVLFEPKPTFSTKTNDRAGEISFDSPQ